MHGVTRHGDRDQPEAHAAHSARSARSPRLSPIPVRIRAAFARELQLRTRRSRSRQVRGRAKRPTKTSGVVVFAGLGPARRCAPETDQNSAL